MKTVLILMPFFFVFSLLFPTSKPNASLHCTLSPPFPRAGKPLFLFSNLLSCSLFLFICAARRRLPCFSFLICSASPFSVLKSEFVLCTSLFIWSQISSYQINVFKTTIHVWNQILYCLFSLHGQPLSRRLVIFFSISFVLHCDSFVTVERRDII